jgi:hypothetical protein
MSRFVTTGADAGNPNLPGNRQDLPLLARLALIFILLLVLFPLSLGFALPALGLVGLVALDLASVDLVGRAIRYSFLT